MLCKKCRKEIPEGSLYCNHCGKKQENSPEHTKKRGNGQGTVYKRPCGTWAAQVTLGYYMKEGKRIRKTAKKYGFKTKKEAVAYIETLRRPSEKPKRINCQTLWELFDTERRELSKSKRTAYNIAWRKIEKAVNWRTIDSFTVPELQDIVDESAVSYYTARDIKSLLSKFYKLAIRDDYVTSNKAQYIKLPKLESSERPVFSKMRSSSCGKATIKSMITRQLKYL